jgi:hypothetical protein
MVIGCWEREQRASEKRKDGEEGMEEKDEERTAEKTNSDWLVRQTPSSCEPRVAASLDPRLVPNGFQQQQGLEQSPGSRCRGWHGDDRPMGHDGCDSSDVE